MFVKVKEQCVEQVPNRCRSPNTDPAYFFMSNTVSPEYWRSAVFNSAHASLQSDVLDDHALLQDLCATTAGMAVQYDEFVSKAVRKAEAGLMW